MPRKTSSTPEAKLYYSAGFWRVYWFRDGKKYSYSTGLTQKGDRRQAELIRRTASFALLGDPPQFDEQLLRSKTIRRYLQEYYPQPSAAPAATAEGRSDAWQREYSDHLSGKVDPEWAKESLSILRRLENHVNGDILATTPGQAQAFLDNVTSTRKTKADRRDGPQKKGAVTGILTNARRNRILYICTKFFKWALRAGKATSSPFQGISKFAEERSAEIVYCTPAERARMIAAARASGRRDWLAVPIAFYAGCRRSEIYRLDWEHISFEAGRITIMKSKKKVSRTLPLAKELEAVLRPHARQSGPVVGEAQGTWKNEAERLVETLRELLGRPLRPGVDGRPVEPAGKRSFVKSAVLKACDQGGQPARNDGKNGQTKEILIPIWLGKTVDRLPWIPAERIGWNVFRHTFGSILAQRNVGLDKISSWMGNTQEVCRRHYAQFVPRDSKDMDIDLL